MVLVVSFAALAALWSRPRLEWPAWRPLPAGHLLGSRPVEVACGALGVALLVLVVLSGLFGTQRAVRNFAPPFVFVDVWIGFVFASLPFGDVFRAFNPWRAIGRATGAELHRAPRAAYSVRWGRWPAAAGLLAFTWFELASGLTDDPRAVAGAVAAYSLLAHYLTALVYEGQLALFLVSDPLVRGWDVFGTADGAIDYSLLSQNLTWYLQVGFVIAGLVLAHDRALVLHGQARRGARSTGCSGVMVGFTTLALWLLAQASA